MSDKREAVRSDPVPDDVARLLATVPEWFGLPDANTEYIEAARVKETWVVRDDAGQVIGVTLIDRHFPRVVEIYLTVVDRSVHGSGVGTAMVEAVERDSIERGVELMEVKTLGASHPDEGYSKTRHFYKKMGFVPLEETDLWGEDSPCLFMVKPLGRPQTSIVCICGSTRFREEIAEAYARLTLGGEIVLSPALFQHSGDKFTGEQKERLGELHLRKIDLADWVYVVDPGGYIGESTSREIAYAESLGKPVVRLSS